VSEFVIVLKDKQVVVDGKLLEITRI